MERVISSETVKNITMQKAWEWFVPVFKGIKINPNMIELLKKEYEASMEKDLMNLK